MLSNPVIPTLPNKPARLLHSQWLIHIEQCQQNQLNPADYCQQHHLSLYAFKKHVWLERRKSLLPPAAGPFVPVTLLGRTEEPRAGYEIVFPRGVVLKIPASVLLTAIVTALRDGS